jgi:hypothetical protein
MLLDFLVPPEKAGFGVKFRRKPPQRYMVGSTTSASAMSDRVSDRQLKQKPDPSR